ncbi:Fe-S protein assembly co-chaperone HscB [Microbulbifer sp. OS29]|uniref:Co-chaperone protein HscB homolog n=1 Tax=Microbulbifer okhotskensis TaxID=2926617 RepID=A0A9X2J3S8_9GAMM|nr:Fe-S protein assembly co-chaperone HscB [Microbulbifer okhotskensis]MCO1333822.1 Fe-S protein assembly co-chaperone HscB [Microbulbifer okhotskensis]
MATNLNHFEVFGLQPAFELDRSTLAARYRELQREFHPDKYVSRSDSEQLLAIKMAAQINEAHTVLRDPVQRAGYLLKLAGVEVPPEQTTSDTEFLMQQMLLREQLEEVRDQADPAAALDELNTEVQGLISTEERRFAEAYGAKSLRAAEESLRKLQFLVKLAHQIDEREEDLFNN